MSQDEKLQRIVPLEQVRNIGVMAHIDAGKTTISERILFYSGTTWRLGEVHEGTATMDWMQQEQERGITITSAATTCFWKQHRINLIDMPGHVDFTAEVERSLCVLEGLILVFCAAEGIQAQTEVVWQQAEKHNIPVISFINKMDRIGADFDSVLVEIEEQFDIVPAPLFIPLENYKERFLIDVIEEKIVKFSEDDFGKEYHYEELPKDEIETCRKARSHLISILAESDEEILEAFVTDAEISNVVLKRSIQKLTFLRQILPICCGSAYQNWGVQLLMDMVNEYLPSPLSVTSKNNIVAGDDKPFVAMIFKIIVDRRFGPLVFFRVFSGIAVPHSEVLDAESGNLINMGRLLQIHANYYEERNGIFSGDIGAMKWLPGMKTGDTLCDPKHRVLLETIKFPEPVMKIAVEAKSFEDQAKMEQSLQELVMQDPTLRLKKDPMTGQVVLSGMGELHLEIILERLKKEYGVLVNIGRPQVTRFATFKENSSGEAELESNFGPVHIYGRVELKVTPLPKGSGIVLEDEVGDTLAQDFRVAIRQGIFSAVEHGVLASFPLTDICISVCKCKANDNEGSIALLKKLAVDALEEAAKKTELKILSPWMKLRIDSPQANIGAVIGEIQTRKGKVIEVEAQSRTTRVIGLVPLAELFGYATALRTQSSGRAVFVSELACFAEATEEL